MTLSSKLALGAAAAAVFAAISFACGGEEVVELVDSLDAGGNGSDATIPDQWTDSDASGGADGPAGDGARDGEGGVDPCATSRTRCLPLGAHCNVALDCCSARCEQGYCIDPGSCSPPGTSCTARAQCCSGLCEVVDGGQRCLNYCKPDGVDCTSALDCCSLACNGGKCGGALCSGDEGCSVDSDCCSNSCDKSQGRCRLGSASCTSSGVECSAQCCGGSCIYSDAGYEPRCDLGQGPCRPPGALCNQTSDCCRGTCTTGPNGFGVCTAPCLADGTSCQFAGDCCGKICGGNPQTCSSAPVECKLTGTACSGDQECCTGQCFSGTCGSTCPPK